MPNTYIQSILENKHYLIHYIYLRQFLITITFAEDKGHCEHQQQTMPVSILPASQSCPPKQSTMILSLFAHDFASAPCFFDRNMVLSSVESKARQGPCLIYWWHIFPGSLTWTQVTYNCASESPWGKEGGCIKTYLVLNLAMMWLIFDGKLYIHLCISVCMFMHMYVCKCWVHGGILNCSVTTSDHLAEKAIHQSSGGNYDFGISGKTVLVYSKNCL